MSQSKLRVKNLQPELARENGIAFVWLVVDHTKLEMSILDHRAWPMQTTIKAASNFEFVTAVIG